MNMKKKSLKIRFRKYFEIIFESYKYVLNLKKTEFYSQWIQFWKFIHLKKKKNEIGFYPVEKCHNKAASDVHKET